MACLPRPQHAESKTNIFVAICGYILLYAATFAMMFTLSTSVLWLRCSSNCWKILNQRALKAVLLTALLRQVNTWRGACAKSGKTLHTNPLEPDTHMRTHTHTLFGLTVVESHFDSVASGATCLRYVLWRSRARCSFLFTSHRFQKVTWLLTMQLTIL